MKALPQGGVVTGGMDGNLRQLHLQRPNLNTESDFQPILKTLEGGRGRVRRGAHYDGEA